MGDIIQFPWKATHKTPQPKSIDEIIEQSKFVQEFHVNETIDGVGDRIFEHLGMHGFIFEEDDMKDAEFVVEAVKSILMRKKGLTHPFHEYIDKIVEFNEQDGFVLDMNLKITKKKKKKPTEIKTENIME